MTASPRWNKILGDFFAMRGRVGLMVAALAIGMLTLTTITGAYSILAREISRNYLATNPAAALIDLGAVTPEALDIVRSQPGVVDAEPTSIVVGRSRRNDGAWFRSLLFISADPSATRIGHPLNTPPTALDDQSVLFEREAASLLGVTIDDTVSIQAESGDPRQFRVAGLVHDPSLAPAWQEQTAYIYLSSAVAAAMGIPATPELIKISVGADLTEQGQVDVLVAQIASSLKSQGIAVHQVRIPPLRQHPHQSQMTGVLSMFLVFALLAVVLGAVLTAAMISALLTQQARQIAIMKTIGGSGRQIARLYLTATAVLALISTLMGLAVGLVGASGFARIIAQLLNFDIASAAVPFWIILALMVLGLLLPVGLVLLPVRRASAATIRDALDDQGIAIDTLRGDPIQALLGRVRGVDRTLVMALRNVFRRRARLALNLALLGTAGAFFIAALNVETAWKGQLDLSAQSRDYAIEVSLLGKSDPGEAAAALSSIHEIISVTEARSIPGAAGRPDGLMLVRTYPDGGHGSLSLRPLGSLPPGAPIILGKDPSNGDALVNQQAFNLLGRPDLAEPVSLADEIKTRSVRLAGVVRQILVPATAYLPDALFDGLASGEAASTSLRLRLAPGASAESIAHIAEEAVFALSRANIAVEQVITEATLAAAQSGHVAILITVLQVMAMMMAAVGSIGLAASLGSSVTERTREFGIMRTIGAGRRILMRNIMAEGLLVAALSVPLAILAALPVGYVVGQLVGLLSFGLPLPLTLSTSAVGLWIFIVAAGAILASLVPARRAASLTIRQTLAYT